MKLRPSPGAPRHPLPASGERAGVRGRALAAWLAPSRPMAHALALGIVGVVLSTVATIMTWNRGPAFGPHWYPIALILVSMPCAWIGAALFTSRRARA